jgi:hypothetical protein
MCQTHHVTISANHSSYGLYFPLHVPITFYVISPGTIWLDMWLCHSTLWFVILWMFAYYSTPDLAGILCDVQSSGCSDCHLGLLSRFLAHVKSHCLFNEFLEYS